LKILQCISDNQTYDGVFAEIVNSFVVDAYKESIFAKIALMDTKSIEFTKNIIESSVIKSQDREHIKTIEGNIKQFMNDQNMVKSLVQQSNKKEKYDTLMRYYKENWSLKYSKKGVSTSTKDDFNLIIFKSMSKIKTTIECARDWIIKVLTDKDQPNLLDMQLLASYDNDDKHTDRYLVNKMPFPFTNREWVVTRWEIFEPGRYISLEYSIDRPDRPINKKIIRAYMILAGYIVEQDPESPENISVCRLFQGDIKGSVPSWLKKFGWKSLYKGLLLMKQELEVQNLTTSV